MHIKAGYKVVLIKCRSRQQTELGKIVNLMSADVNHVMQFFYPFFNQLFSAPALLIASLILLYFQIRYAAVIHCMVHMAVAGAVRFYSTFVLAACCMHVLAS